MRVKARYEKSIIPSDELEKATNTLIGKPVHVNFDTRQLIGRVLDAVYNNDGIDLDLDLYDVGVSYWVKDGFHCFDSVSLTKKPIGKLSEFNQEYDMK